MIIDHTWFGNLYPIVLQGNRNSSLVPEERSADHSTHFRRVHTLRCNNPNQSALSEILSICFIVTTIGFLIHCFWIQQSLSGLYQLIQSCGDTCIFEQNGLNAEVNFTQEDIQSQLSGAITDNTIIAGIVNKYKNSFGKSRVVVIKSQLGQPITAYSGDKVYWKIPQDLPKMTKLMIDGKALYIHRANFQIIDKELLK